ITGTILLDEMPVQVTTNLLAVLRRIRRRYWDFRSHGDYVWIDALCINQADTEEKNSQVSMMREIYRQADLLCIWLGDDEQDFDIAHSQVRVYAAVIEVFEDS